MTTADVTSSSRPLVGLTIGDPAGIGPEVVVGALRNAELHRIARVVILGDLKVVERAQEVLGDRSPVRSLANPADGQFESGVLNLLDVGGLRDEDVVWGQVQPQAGRAAFAYVQRGI